MTAMLYQLYALRAQVEALIVMAEAGQAPVNPATKCPTCGATDEQIEDVSTIDGTKRRLCKSCRHEWTL